MSTPIPTNPHQWLEPPTSPQTIYLVGAGGCGMSGLGHLLLDLGFDIAGSDLVRNDEVRQLQQRGATIFIGHAPEQLPRVAPKLVVYSSAIPPTNPELLAARSRGLPVVHRATVLAHLVQRQRGICVAGMHGKTTTTAGLAFALNQMGAHPSYAIGALVPQLRPHARLTCPPPADAQPPWFVVEADESDGSLREFRPLHSILLNVDEEHLDHYGNLDRVCQAFEEFARNTSGTVIYCADDERLGRIVAPCSARFSYGFSASAEYRLEPRVTPEGWAFRLWYDGALLGTFPLRLIGRQNLSNAAAVAATLHQLGYAPDRIAAALAEFRGAARRQELLYCDDQFRVFDDYGHHPREILATLEALKALGCRRLLVAFQPHRYTRTQHLIDQFATCFQAADRLWLTEIYAASEPAIAGVDGGVLAAAVRRQGQPAEYVASLEDLVPAVRGAMQPGDLVLFLGAGDITRVAHELAAQLSRKQPLSSPAPPPPVGPPPSADVLDRLVAQLSPATLWRRQEPLAKHTTLRVGGPADLYVEPVAEAELGRVLQYCQERQLPVLLLGRGSNLLVRDQGFRGIVICLAHPDFAKIQVEGERLQCGAGARLKSVVREAKRQGLGGLEFLEGIPGCVGGALRMNAGAMGGDIFRVIESVRVMDMAGRVWDQSVKEFKVDYRECATLRERVVLAAGFRGQPTDPQTITQVLAAYGAKRGSSQPAAPSAGCVFRNPTTIPAGKLIDELGCKGMRVGGALVSDVHANFLVNSGSATAQDFLSLISLIQQRARAERGIELETELVIVGD